MRFPSMVIPLTAACTFAMFGTGSCCAAMMGQDGCFVCVALFCQGYWLSRIWLVEREEKEMVG